MDNGIGGAHDADHQKILGQCSTISCWLVQSVRKGERAKLTGKYLCPSQPLMITRIHFNFWNAGKLIDAMNFIIIMIGVECPLCYQTIKHAELFSALTSLFYRQNVAASYACFPLMMWRFFDDAMQNSGNWAFGPSISIVSNFPLKWAASMRSTVFFLLILSSGPQLRSTCWLLYHF